jgi:outer membrane protein assembly factor BamB
VRRLLGAVAAVAIVAASPAVAAAPRLPTVRATDWPTYGHDQHRTFAGVTSLTPATVPALAPRWFFPTGDAVTANPVVVDGTVYVGSWDGRFYAIDDATGKPRWSFRVDDQPAVAPSPRGRQLSSDDFTSDGGIITSSAWFQPASPLTHGRPLVLFGGGYTLYALDAVSGRLVWKRPFTGRPEAAPKPAVDEARIFASPAVVGRLVVFAVSPDGQRGHRGYVAAADLATGTLVWRFETDVDRHGKVLNDGCGGVWTSPTVDEADGLVIEAVADCHFLGTPPYNERVLALRVRDGGLAWVYTPRRLAKADPKCDYDFGATANLGRGWVGIAGKDGTYYALDPRTGHERWETNVVFGGLAGGFIGTTAYDGRRVYGATALGDFGRFEGFGQAECFGDPRDTPVQEPSIFAFDRSTGRVAWQGEASQSFGPTTVAGGMTFVATGITRQLQVRSASSGLLLHALPLPAPSDSGVVVAGRRVYLGLGSTEQGRPAGVLSLGA